MPFLPRSPSFGSVRGSLLERLDVFFTSIWPTKILRGKFMDLGRSFVIVKSEKPESQQQRFSKLESFPTKYGSVQIQRLPENKSSLRGNSS